MRPHPHVSSTSSFSLTLRIAYFANAKLDRVKGLHLNLERVVKLHSFLIPFNRETDVICQSQINALVQLQPDVVLGISDDLVG